MAATPMPKTKAPAAVDQALAGRRSLNATARKAPGPNMAGGGLNPAAGRQTPPILSPAQKPPAWQALAQAGMPGQGSAAANRAAAANLGSQTQPMQPPRGGGIQIMDGAPGTAVPPGPVGPGGGAPGIASMDGIQAGKAGPPGMFDHVGQLLGTPGAMDPGTAENIRRMGGTPPPGAGAPPPGAGGTPPGGYNANLGADIAQRLSALRMGQGSPQGQGMMGGEMAANQPGGQGNPVDWNQSASLGKPTQPSFSDFWASPGILPTGRGGGINPGAMGGGRDPMTGGIAAGGGGFGYGGGGGGGRGGGAPGYY